MKKRFTTYYLNYTSTTLSWILLLLSFGLFNVVFGREEFKFTWTQVFFWLIWLFFVFFFLQRQRIHINNGHMFMQGTFATTDIDIDLQKISKVRAIGSTVNFRYKNKNYRILTSKRLKTLLLNAKK